MRLRSTTAPDAARRPGARIRFAVAAVGWLAAATTAAPVRAADGPDTAREELQRALNERVMATPFNPGDIRKAEAYAEQAKREGVAPVVQPPSYWVPGWTCANLVAYPYYVYNDYRNCIYHHRYYGWYWR